MEGIVFAGTAVTRPNSIGTLWRFEHGKDWQTVEGIAPDAAAQAITPHPSKPNVVYAATRKGVYASEDKGLTWREMGLAGEGVQFWSVAIDPRNHDRIFAGTAPVGFYYSEDAGRTWTKAAGTHPERFKITFGGSRAMKIVFHPTNPDVMYAAAEINGLFVSTDGGKSWRAANEAVEKLANMDKYKSREVTDSDTEGMYDAHSAMTTPALPDTLFYACRMGVFTTTDLGRTLTDMEVRKYAPFNYTRDLRYDARDPKKLYVCFSISSRSEAGAMFMSPDLGRTWQRFFPEENAKSTVMGFGVHPREAGGVAAITRHFQVFYTMDGGKAWHETRLPENAGDGFCAAIL